MATAGALPPQLQMPTVGAAPQQIAPWLPGQAPSQQPGYIGTADPSKGQGYAPPPGQQQVPGQPSPYGLDPSLTAYLSQFNSSIANSRKSIDTQLAQAMGELGQRRDAAAKVVAGLPGEVNQAYAPAQAGLQQAGVAGQGALSQDVRGSVGALAGPLQSALAQEKGGGNAMQPYLDLANQANYGAGSSALRQQAMVGQQALDSKQQDFVQSLLQNQLSRQQANDDFYSHSQFTHDLNQQDTQAAHATAVQDATNAHNTAKTDAQDQAISGETGGHIQSQAEMDAIRSSPAYKYAVSSMTTAGFLSGMSPQEAQQVKAMGINIPTLTGSEIATKYAQNPQLLYALLADNRITPADISKAGIQLPSGK